MPSRLSGLREVVMSNANLIIAITAVGLAGGGLLVFATKRKPEWKKPVYWACIGIILFQCLRYAIEFAIR